MDSDNAEIVEGVIQTDADVEGVADFNDQVPENEGSDLSTDSDASVEADAGTTFDELAQKKGFDSPDALAKAYQELEKQNKQVEMDRSSLLKARTEVVKDNEVEAKDADLNSKTLREIREINEKMELRELFDKYKDAPEYAKAMAEHVKAHPKASWESAYRFVRFDDLAKEAKREGKDEAYQNIQEKQKAQSTGAQPKKILKKNINSLLQDKSVPLADIEKLLPHS